MDRSKVVKRKKRKSQEKEQIKREIKQEIKKIAPKPSEVAKKLEQLPPKKRKAYLRKIVLSFAKGAAVTAGVIVTADVVFVL